MKRIAFTVVSLLFVVAVCLSQFAEPKRAMAAAKPPAVVVLQCIIVNQGSPPTVVYAVDGSVNSPVINAGGSCAAALLTLVTDGFTVQGTQLWSPEVLVYTMVRTT
jgi:hypothetical protein